MFQCYFLSSSHPLLPHCSLVCVSISALQIGSSVPFFQILYIFVDIWYLFFSFWFTSFCITGSRFIHLKNCLKFISFYGWVIFHRINVPQLLYPFICWWTSRVLLCPGYCKQCCSKHCGTCDRLMLLRDLKRYGSYEYSSYCFGGIIWTQVQNINFVIIWDDF